MASIVRRKLHHNPSNLQSRLLFSTTPVQNNRSNTGKRIEKILVANRGEIACRIMRTAKRLGLRTVAVYSDADSHSLHVKSADESVRIGPPAARSSYLNASSIIEAAIRTGAQVIIDHLSVLISFCVLITVDPHSITPIFFDCHIIHAERAKHLVVQV